MGHINWESVSWVATAIAFPVAALGLVVVIYQTHLQRKQNRLDRLSDIWAQMDTHEARLAREYIYSAPASDLRLDVLDKPEFAEQKRRVDDALAALERLAYPIARGRLPEKDAFEFYGGVLLSISKKLWPYVQDQRKMREHSDIAHRLEYRRFLEEVIRLWAPEYANRVGLPRVSTSLSTQEMLDSIFPVAEAAHNRGIQADSASARHVS